MAVNSKQKGKTGELEFTHWLNDRFQLNARRGVQYSGGVDSPDIVSDLRGVHFEVKRVERLNVDNAMEQASRDAGEKKVPVVAHRRNRKQWLLTLRAQDVKRFINAFQEAL